MSLIEREDDGREDGLDDRNDFDVDGFEDYEGCNIVVEVEG